MYSASGSCTSGQATVQWDKQGPPGSPGAQGPPGVSAAQGVAYGAGTYTNGFSVSSTVTARGNYAFEGTIARERTLPNGATGNFSVTCSVGERRPGGVPARFGPWPSLSSSRS